MYWWKCRINSRPWISVFEDDGGGKDGGGGNKDDDKKKEDKEKKFSQEDINRFLAEDRRKAEKKHKDELKRQSDELEALKTKASMTQEERQKLEQRIEDLRRASMTKEEIAKEEQQKAKRAHDEEIKKLEDERDKWQGRFTESTIRRAIIDAAASKDAYNPSQVEAILRPLTSLKETLDDEGQPTGELEPSVDFHDTDKEGKSVTLKLTVPEAVGRMTKLDQFANLFKGSGTGGLGGNNRTTGKAQTAKELAKDPVAYRKARREGKI